MQERARSSQSPVNKMMGVSVLPLSQSPVIKMMSVSAIPLSQSETSSELALFSFHYFLLYDVARGHKSMTWKRAED